MYRPEKDGSGRNRMLTGGTFTDSGRVLDTLLAPPNLGDGTPADARGTRTRVGGRWSRARQGSRVAATAERLAGPGPPVPTEYRAGVSFAASATAATQLDEVWQRPAGAGPTRYPAGLTRSEGAYVEVPPGPPEFLRGQTGIHRPCRSFLISPGSTAMPDSGRSARRYGRLTRW